MNLPQSSEVVSRLLNGDYAIDSDGTTFHHPNGRIEPMRTEVFMAEDGYPALRAVECRHLIPLSSPPVCPTCEGWGNENYAFELCPDCNGSGHFSGPVTITAECNAAEYHGSVNPAADCPTGQRKVAEGHIQVLPVLGIDNDADHLGHHVCVGRGVVMISLAEQDEIFASHLLDKADWSAVQWAGLVTELVAL